MIILLHSSKTMRPAPVEPFTVPMDQPALLAQATAVAEYLQSLSKSELASAMHITGKLADTTYTLIHSWSPEQSSQRAAIDSFLGDIYSGLQVQTLTKADRTYANKHLRILSGLYGVIRPLDGICPYRLEMGYRMPDDPYRNLYNYWGSAIAKTIPTGSTIVNLAAVEYSKTVTRFWEPSNIVTPSFLTVSPKTKKPTFVTVHTKIARGAFAHWLILNRIDSITELHKFTELNYVYNNELSTRSQPVFVCQTFGGLGLSVRLT